MTAAIDVFSRCLVGLVVTLEAPSALSAGLCLGHMVTDKRAWLERLEEVEQRPDVPGGRAAP
jgi:putative transposase